MISIWYLQFINFVDFGNIIAISMVTGIILDLPLGIVTDFLGQKFSFIASLILPCLDKTWPLS